MVVARVDLKQLAPAQRAEVIYSTARCELSSRLWRAALGSGDTDESDGTAATQDRMGFDTLLSLLESHQSGGAQAPAFPSAEGNDDPDPAISGIGAQASVCAEALGPNAKHKAALSSAAERTGIPANALAAIVNAEAAKGRDGSWQIYSRNPRSSAAGIGQFLSGTWQGMAQTKGTWLNSVAREKGWLSESGQVLSSARSELLALRYDPVASINTIADYARQNLDGLRRAGVSIGSGADEIAQKAYLGHQLGLRDAIRFSKGGLDAARARTLLGAQVGAGKASRQIASAGNATVAHRQWLLDFVNRNIRPQNFTARAASRISFAANTA